MKSQIKMSLLDERPLILLGFINYGPYHQARLRACREFLPLWNVKGWQLAPLQHEYAWESKPNDHVLSVSKGSLETSGRLSWLIKTWQHLDQLNPQACVLAGYSHTGMLGALLWCKLHRRPVILMSDSKSDDAPRQLWIEKIKGWIVRRFDSALVAGSAHGAYLQLLGFRQSKIFKPYDVIDNSAFSKQISFLPPHTKPYFLTISRFVPKKNLTCLLQGYADYKAQIGHSQAWDLVVCGDGELYSALLKKRDELDLKQNVHFPGFLQEEQLIPYLSHAKSLVHVSIQDQWGLVVNEAMAASLPVIVSSTCGCVPDLVHHEKNGFVFSAKSSDELAKTLARMHQLSEEERAKMGHCGQQHVTQNYSLKNFAHGFESAVKEALKL